MRTQEATVRGDGAFTSPRRVITRGRSLPWPIRPGGGLGRGGGETIALPANEGHPVPVRLGEGLHRQSGGLHVALHDVVGDHVHVVLLACLLQLLFVPSVGVLFGAYDEASAPFHHRGGFRDALREVWPEEVGLEGGDDVEHLLLEGELGHRRLLDPHPAPLHEHLVRLERLLHGDVGYVNAVDMRVGVGEHQHAHEAPAAAADVEHPPGSSDVGGAGHHPRGDLAVVLVHLRYDRPAFVALRVHVLVLLSHGIADTA